MIDLQRLKTDVMALGLLALAVFVALSLFSYDPADPPSQIVFPPRPVAGNVCGSTGAAVAHNLRQSFGLGCWFLLFSLVTIDVQLFSRSTRRDNWIRTFGGILGLTAVCAGLHMFQPALPDAPLVGSGGYVGAWGNVLLRDHFTPAGSAILVGTTLIAGLLLLCENRFFSGLYRCVCSPFTVCAAVLGAIVALRKWLSGGNANRHSGDESELASADDAASDTGDSATESDGDELADDDPANNIRVNPPVSLIADSEDAPADIIPMPAREFALPDVEVLEQPEDFPYELLAKKARVAAGTLEKTFQEFGLNVRVSEIDTGPVITQFELELEPGLRLSKVTALADDLAIALRVPSVRVVAPIPGKNTVGVEVPNAKQVMVRLRELIEAGRSELADSRLPMFLGKDVSGQPLTVDLAKMPHLLIAGRTGTGKSVCLNTLILSLLMTRTPDEVRMLMIDPKMVELSPYRRVPHLMHPVITDMKKAEAVLGWAVDKMEERYDLLARCGVRHLDAYNRLSHEDILDRVGVDPYDDEAESIPEKMPYIVIIADEMADMMMTSGKDVEASHHPAGSEVASRRHPPGAGHAESQPST